MAKHTPGPYKILPRDFGYDIVADSGLPITGTDWAAGGRLGAIPDANNALLFATAPDTAAERDRLREVNAELVKALDYVLCCGRGTSGRIIIDQQQEAVIRAALAKTGEN